MDRMKSTDEQFTQLATRIPKSLHRKLKLHVVTTEQSVMAFVVSALQEKLKKEGARG